MAPLEGITSANVYKAIGVFMVVSSLIQGTVLLNHGLTQPPDDLFFGVDSDTLAGLWWLFSAVVWAYLFRRLVHQEARIEG
jgi:hypothetical protein